VVTETYTWTRDDGTIGTGKRYVARATIAGKRVKRTSQKSPTDAQRQLNEVRDRAARGVPPANGRLRAQHIFDQWLETKAAAERKPRTLKSYRELVELHLGPGLSHLPADRLQDDATIQAFLSERRAAHDERGRRLSARRIEMMRDALRGAINLAMKRQQLFPNPVGKQGTVEAPKVRRKVHVALSYVESQALLAAARGHRHEHLYVLLLAAGLRLGEALAVRMTNDDPAWSWADLEQGVLHVRQTLEPLSGPQAKARGIAERRWDIDDLKGERYRDVPRWRDVPLTDEAIATIRAQQRITREHRLRAGSAWHDHGFLFVDEIGEPFTQSSVNKAIKHVGRRARVERIHAHLLRRTTATYLHAKGVPLATIQAILGHATIGVTMGYIDATALDVMEQARAGMAAAFADVRQAPAG